MTERREQGNKVDKGDIKKHKNDVFRLYQIISQDLSFEIPALVQADLQRFIDAMTDEVGINLKSLGLRNITIDEVLNQLRMIYGLDH